MRTVLVPDRTEPAWSEGVIKRAFGPAPTDEMPHYWKPKLAGVEGTEREQAFAFPTPFAWAEMTGAVIRQQAYDHFLYERFDYLLRGLILGHLQLEVVDLEEECGQFGKLLKKTDRDYRYFGLIRTNSSNADLPQRVFGATSPEPLFWPSPRPTKEEWASLGEAIRNDKNLKHAYMVLADFRELLDRAKLWDGNSDEAPWMKAIDRILSNQKLSIERESGNKHFHIHSRQIGPVNVRFRDGKAHHLYFPVYHQNFAASFLKGLTGSFERTNGAVAVYDYTKRRCYEINSRARTGEDVILAGVGTIRVIHEPAEDVSSAQIRLSDLFELMQDLRRAAGEDVGDIKKHPFFYADVLRISVMRLGEAGVNTDVTFSDEAYKLAFDPSSVGLPLASELKEVDAGTNALVLNYFDENNQQKRAIYVERYAGSSVGDLKALGWVLWSYFTGSAYVSANTVKVEDLQGDTVSALKESGSTRPFDLKPFIYRKVNDERDKHRRLASLQRFLKAYKDRLNDEKSYGIDNLLFEAASAFVEHIWSETGVIANGPISRAAGATLRLGGIPVELAKDVVPEGE